METTVLTVLGTAAVKAGVVLVLAGVVCLLLRRHSAAHRHAVWSAAVVVALGMPVLILLAPAVHIPVDLPSVSDNPLPMTGYAAREASSNDPVAVSIAPDDPFVPAVGEAVVFPSPAAALAPAVLPSSRPGSTIFLLGVWAIGAGFVLLRMLFGMGRLSWIRRQATPVSNGALWNALRAPALRLHLPDLPLLVIGAPDAVPMTWGLFRSIVLLPAGAEEWPERQLDAVLMHELGHIARRDYAVQFGAHIACALYWFNPLMWLAAHRLRVEREFACDDLVVRSGHESATYAEELLRIARSLRMPPRTAAIAIGVTRSSPLRDRLLAILDDSRDKRPPSNLRLAAIGTTALVVATLVAAASPAGIEAIEADQTFPTASPVVPASVRQVVESSGAAPVTQVTQAMTAAAPEATVSQAPAGATVLCGPGDGEARRRSHHTDDDVVRVVMEYSDCQSEVEIKGDIDFTDDFSAIEGIAPGGSLRIEVARRNYERRLEATPGVRYRWWVDGDERPFDAEARAWLSEALLDVFRNTSYLARERATWILQERGINGVFAEVGEMSSDHVQAVYLTTLLESPRLSREDVRRVIRTAASELESDHSQGRLFQAALSRSGLTADDLDLLLRSAAASIESDHTMAELLVDLAERYPAEAQLREPYLAAAATIESDHSKGRVYQALLKMPGMSSQDVARVLAATSTIGSDHTRSNLLIELADRGLVSTAEQRAFLKAAAGIGSDHAKGESLRAFLRLNGVAEDEQLELLRTAETIGSDHTLSQLLIEFIDTYRVRGTVEQALRRTLDSVRSSHSRSQVERALTNASG